MDTIVKEYAATEASIPAARKVITDVFTDHPNAYDARLLVTELATNAVRHGTSPKFTLTVEHTASEILVAVTNDGTGDLPNLKADPYGDLTAESGRGLGFCADFADHWGITFTDRCVRAWFAFAAATTLVTA